MTQMRKSNRIPAIGFVLLAALMVSFGACLAVEDDCCESDESTCTEICHCACAFHSTSPLISFSIHRLTECGAVGSGPILPDHADIDFDLDRPPRLFAA